ncbi:TIGR02301 family protein [Pseudochrobactrum kiredjianiae]|uniref:TIGR02301 family protein n=1 Tax=Pseudochrobactrum kiredjianiae TaxID=386305 RepID=A0ABW3V9P9_9HYPH|nr:TIGR02301 family protein [Pseudochrobactrum kiredjianiae]MDM7850557.1 TIGR02301 family protein [Pseudochrobactrum kiredjianiae]
MTRYFVSLLLLAGLTVSGSSANAQDISGPPYEHQMIQLAETLGSLHYLSNLCSDKNNLWRDQMNELITAEKADTNRRKVLISAFNNSYRTYSDNYSQCTDQALKAIERFKQQGEKLTEALVAHYGN